MTSRLTSCFSRVSSNLFCTVLLVATLATASLDSKAQTPSSIDSALTAFVNRSGEFIYAMAWPTARYTGIRYEGATRVANGMDVIATVHGRSGFDDSHLWVEVVLEIRNAAIKDVRFGRHNAILMAPGVTMTAFGQMLKEINRELQSTSGTPSAQGLTSTPNPLYSAVCVQNPTNQSLVYRIWWGANSQQIWLESGAARIYSVPGTVHQFSIEFDNNFAEGYTPTRYFLPTSTHAARPTSCEEPNSYSFGIRGQSIQLTTD